MDDFFLFVEALVNGRDWYAYVQIPHSKWSVDIAQGLAYGGLWQLFNDSAQSIEVEQVESPKRVLQPRPGSTGTPKKLQGQHFTIKISGIRDKWGRIVNDLLISLQLPPLKEQEGLEVAAQMVEMGLGYYCGNTIKRVRVCGAGETLPGALEKIETRLS